MTFTVRHLIPQYYWFIFVDSRTGRWVVSDEKFDAVSVSFHPQLQTGQYDVTYALNVYGRYQHVAERDIFEDPAAAKLEADTRNDPYYEGNDAA